MHPRFLTLLMMTVMLANQAIIALGHSHGEFSDPSSRPHIHLSSHNHSHDHGYSHLHGHSHHHGHPHHGHQHNHHHHGDGHHHHDSDPQQDDHSTDDPSVQTCELVFIADADVVISQTGQRVGITELVLRFSESAALLAERNSDFFIEKPSKTRTALAHAPILNKIRLLI